MFRRLGAGSGALWRPWYDGGHHGERELMIEMLCCVFCVSIVRKLLPREKPRVVFGKLLPRGKPAPLDRCAL